MHPKSQKETEKEAWADCVKTATRPTCTALRGTLSPNNVIH